MLREKLVFGPIFSRRLGASLGINLLPENGKLCNFDCIYCECGWNKDGRDDKRLPLPEELRSALDAKLKSCLEEGTRIDSITFSGDGEPTINPHFAEMIDITLELRDRYFPESVVSVLSNATKICREDVRNALMKVDNPILKLDAATDEFAERINNPACDYSVEEIVADMKAFEGNFILQTMFLKTKDFNTAAPENLGPWMDIVRELRPREIMVYTVARETPEAGLEKFSEQEMREAVMPLINEGFNIQIKG